MSNSRRKFLATLFPFTMIVGVVVCGSLVTGAGTASAENAGKKINYVDHFAYGRCTVGRNQNNENVRSCAQLNPGSNLGQEFLWTGEVRITWYYDDHTYTVTDCSAPEGLVGDYFTCHDPR